MESTQLIEENEIGSTALNGPFYAQVLACVCECVPGLCAHTDPAHLLSADQLRNGAKPLKRSPSS